MKKVVWDTENAAEAINWDGSKPHVEGDVVYIVDLTCACDPGNPCGGCVDTTDAHDIGNSQYCWKEI